MKFSIFLLLLIASTNIYSNLTKCIAIDISGDAVVLNKEMAQIQDNKGKLVYELEYKGEFGKTLFYYNDKINAVIYFNNTSLEVKIVNFDDTAKITNTRFFMCSTEEKKINLNEFKK